MANTPGSILKKTRESKKFNIAQAVKGTRIRAIYIHALEADDYQMLPSPVQLRGFLRIYAEFLGLNSNDVLSLLPSQYLSDVQDIPPSSELEPRKPDKSVDENSHSEDRLNAKKPQLDVNNSFPETMKEEIKLTKGRNGEEIESLEGTSENHDQKNRAIEIFSSIGAQLKNRRELLGISIKEVEANTHVLKRYLVSIEAGRFDNLETTVQTKGMLSNYAQFLDLDVDEILLQYAEGLQLQREEGLDNNKAPDNNHPATNKIISLIKRFISIDLIVGSAAIIFLLLFIIWGTGKVIDLYREPGALATSASISDVILTPINSSPEANLSNNQLTPISTEPTSADTIELSETQILQQGEIQIHAVVLLRTWIRVTVDGVVKLEGRVEPGSAFPFSGYDQIEILTSNGAALQIVYNQTNLGLMGEFGQVVNLIYTPSSILSPTATITPTSTITPTPTRTPIVTMTPLP